MQFLTTAKLTEMATLAQRHAHLEAVALKLTTVCATAGSFCPNSAKIFEFTDRYTDYLQCAYS